MKHKANRAQEIISQVQVLLKELSSSLGSDKSTPIPTYVSTTIERYTGPLGGIKLLLKEGFFTEPKTLSEVVNRLHQDGFKYVKQVVSNALVRLVKNRVMVRLPSTGKGRWVYAERK